MCIGVCGIYMRNYTTYACANEGLRLGNNFVDNAVFFCFPGAHPKVAVDVFFDLAELLSGVLGKNFIQPLL